MPPDARAFTVRRAGPPDLVALVRYDWSPLIAERDTIYLFLIQDHSRYCFVAEDASGKALGYLVAARSADGRAVFVFHVHVREKERGRGAGTALMEALERAAAADGASLVWFLARDRARSFYSRLGYSRVDGSFHPEIARYVTQVKRTIAMGKTLGGAPPGDDASRRS